MKRIRVLGFDCAACRKTCSRICELVQRHQIDARVEKSDDPGEMLAFRVMAPPAVVIDGQLVHAGGVPSKGQIERWLLG